MTSRRLFIGSLFTGAAAFLLPAAQTGCAPARKKEDEAAAPETGGAKLKAAGAVIVATDDKKTKIKIKCEKCGFLSAEIEIDTPVAGKPYTQEWTCPKCGHKQRVTVETAAA
jgi:predicted RNA-binding Zn-ribbon protein involved in translation (DUF1610 family)